jgi:hypothetical protein
MTTAKPVNLTERCDVIAFIPSERMQLIAQERTEGIVQAFLLTRSFDWTRFQRNIEILARSCYMQGLNDMTDAVTKRFEVKERAL